MCVCMYVCTVVVLVAVMTAYRGVGGGGRGTVFADTSDRFGVNAEQSVRQQSLDTLTSMLHRPLPVLRRAYHTTHAASNHLPASGVGRWLSCRQPACPQTAQAAAPWDRQADGSRYSKMPTYDGATHTHTHTHTHRFNSPFSGTTRVSRYQKGKTNLDFTEARVRCHLSGAV